MFPWSRAEGVTAIPILMSARFAGKPQGVTMVPKKNHPKLGREGEDLPLKATFFSVRPLTSPARNLLSYIDRRMSDQKENGSRWPATLRIIFAVLLGVASWAVVIGLIWAAIRYFF
jgi:hypothetical protein